MTANKKSIERMFWGFFKTHALVYTRSPHDPVLSREGAMKLFLYGIEIGKSKPAAEKKPKEDIREIRQDQH